MIWVGNLKFLQSALQKPRFGAPLEVHAWLSSEIDLISPFVDWLMCLHILENSFVHAVKAWQRHHSAALMEAAAYRLTLIKHPMD